MQVKEMAAEKIISTSSPTAQTERLVIPTGNGNR